VEKQNFFIHLLQRVNKKTWKIIIFVSVIVILLASGLWVVAKELGITLDPKEGPIAYAPSIKVEEHEIEAYPLNSKYQKYSNLEYEGVDPQFRDTGGPGTIEVGLGYRDSLGDKNTLLDFKKFLDEKAAQMAREKENQEIEVFITPKRPLDDEAFLSLIEKYEIAPVAAMGRGYADVGPGDQRGFVTAGLDFRPKMSPPFRDIEKFVLALHQKVEGDKRLNEEYVGAINIHGKLTINPEKLSTLLQDDRIFVMDATPELIKEHLSNQLKKHSETNKLEIVFQPNNLFFKLEQAFYREELEKQRILL